VQLANGSWTKLDQGYYRGNRFRLRACDLYDRFEFLDTAAIGLSDDWWTELYYHAGGCPMQFQSVGQQPYATGRWGSGSIAISAAGYGCSWTAAANAQWLALDKTSGGSADTVNFTVAGNGTGACRSAIITIAGQNIIVNQSAATRSYSLRSPSATVPSSATTASVGVVRAAGCAWSATGGLRFVRITEGASASGPAYVVSISKPIRPVCSGRPCLTLRARRSL
jgi:hypothetical protein